MEYNTYNDLTPFTSAVDKTILNKIVINSVSTITKSDSFLNKISPDLIKTNDDIKETLAKIVLLSLGACSAEILDELSTSDLILFFNIVSSFSKYKKFLVNYEIKLYYRSTDKISYKDRNNIKSEILRIYTDVLNTTEVIEDDLILFFNKFFSVEIKNQDNLIDFLLDMILTINDNTAKMFLSENSIDAFGIFSFLLNYSKALYLEEQSLINSVVLTDNLKQKTFLKAFSDNVISEKLEETSKFFIEFLDKLSKRTINY